MGLSLILRTKLGDEKKPFSSNALWPLTTVIAPENWFFLRKKYNFKTVSHRDTKTTEIPSLTFDLENKVKVKGQGHPIFF